MQPFTSSFSPIWSGLIPSVNMVLRRIKCARIFSSASFTGFATFFGLMEITREIKGKHGLTEEFFVRRSVLADKVFRLASLL